ncbi:MAG: DUF1697 domain-containing protein [Acidimicrobiia bacterium]
MATSGEGWDTLVVRYAALLRGVNLGPSRKVGMADLRRVLEDDGFGQVETYMRSGNVAFDSDEYERAPLRDRLEDVLATAFGFEISLVLVTADDLDRVVNANPYTEPASADPTKVHVTFLEPAPPATTWRSLDAQDFGEEEFSVGERWIYMHLPNGMGRASLPTALDRAAGQAVATTRNWRTVLRLVDLAGG